MAPSHKIGKAQICTEEKGQTHVFGKKVVCNKENLFVTLGEEDLRCLRSQGCEWPGMVWTCFVWFKMHQVSMLFKNKTLSPSDLLPIACLSFSLTLSPSPSFYCSFSPTHFLPFPLSPFLPPSLLSISLCLCLFLFCLSFPFSLSLCPLVSVSICDTHAHT